MLSIFNIIEYYIIFILTVLTDLVKGGGRRIILLCFVTAEPPPVQNLTESSHPLMLFVVEKFSSWERYLLIIVVHLLNKKNRERKD